MVYLLTAAIIFSYGICLKILWGWFLVPLGIHDISIAHALGIYCLISLITYQYVPNKEGEEYKMIRESITTLIFAMVVGFNAKLFM